MQTEKPKKAATWRGIAITLVLIVLATYIGLNFDLMDTMPWENSVTVSNLSGFTSGSEGECYVVDNGGIRVTAFTKDGEYRWSKEFESTVRSVVVADSGDIFIAHYEFTDANLISHAEIDHFRANGELVGTVFEHTYLDAPNMPVYNAGFLGLTYSGGKLYYAMKDATALYLCALPASSSKTAAQPEMLAKYPYENAAKYVLCAAVDPATEKVYFADKYGKVFLADETGAHVALPYPEAPAAPAFSVPFAMTCASGKLYVSDIGTRQIYVYDGGEFSVAQNMDDIPDVFDNNLLTYVIQTIDDDTVALINSGFVLALSADGDIEFMPSELEYGAVMRARLWLWWVSAAVIAIAVLVIAARALVKSYKSMGAEKLFTNVLIVILIVIITAFIINRYSTSTDERFTEVTVDNLSAMATLTASLIDGDRLETIDTLADYDSEEYREIEAILTPAAGSGQTDRLVYYSDLEFADNGGLKHLVSWDEGVYRMLVRVIDGRVCYVYSSEDQYGAIRPWDYPYYDTEFQQTYETGEAMSFINVPDYTGSYTYTNMPIKNSAGEVVGILEMGINQRAYRQEVNKLMRDIALSVIIVVLVALLLLREIMYFLQLLSKRRPFAARELANVGFVRPLVFLAYFLDCLALVISPLFAMELYSQNLGVSMEIGVALATSVTFLFIGAASMIGARMGRKTGLFPLLIVGIILEIAGECIAATSGDLWMFIAAKAFVGFGAGLVLNIADTFVAMQPDASNVESGFSLSNVGMNSGTNCGVIIGGALGVMWGYRSVYVSGAIVGLIMLIYVIFMFRNANMPDVRGTKGEKAGMGTLRFLFSRGTFAYFIFMCVPYLIVGAFINYFLPVQGSAEGLSEENLSRLVFLYGMVSIYVGPVLMHALVQKLGAKWTLTLSGALLIGALLLYALNPTLTMLILAVVVFAVADSFAFPTQNLYYTQLPEVARYGEGSALGVSNIVNGLAQAASSYAFAFVLIFGVAKGLIFMAAALALFMVLFGIVARRSGRSK